MTSPPHVLECRWRFVLAGGHDEQRSHRAEWHHIVAVAKVEGDLCCYPPGVDAEVERKRTVHIP